jgi:hypothetical protein
MGDIVNVGFGATLLVLFVRNTVLFLRTGVVLRKAIGVAVGIIVLVKIIGIPRPSNRARGDGGSTGSKGGCYSALGASPLDFL